MKKLFLSMMLVFGLLVASGSVYASGESVDGYTSTAVNVRTSPNGTIVETLPILSEVEGTLEGNWIRLSNGNYIYNFGLVEGTPVSGYTLQDLNQRRTPAGEIISVLDKFSYVEGIKTGNYILTDTGRYIYGYDLAQGNLVEVMVNTDTNIRKSPGGSLVGVLGRYSVVKGVENGNNLAIGHERYIYNLGYSYAKYNEGYVGRALNVRNTPNGNLVKTIDFDTYVSGPIFDNWMKLEDGNFVYIYDLFTDVANGYVNTDTNIRSTDLSSVISVAPKGHYFEGGIRNGYLHTTSGGRSVALYANFLEDERIEVLGYTSTTVNVRTASNEVLKKLPTHSLVIGKLTRDGKYVELDRTLFGETERIHESLVVELQKPSSTGFYTLGNRKYYVDKTGEDFEFARGFRTVDGSAYYFDPIYYYGYTGVKNTGTNIYYFNSQGKALKGTRTIRGTSHSQTITFGYPTASELRNENLERSQESYVGQTVVNTAMTAIGTKYQWYGTDLKGGLYCSTLIYAAYIENGIKVPGPEWGNLADAKATGVKSDYSSVWSSKGVYRGYGNAGTYGYQMPTKQYTMNYDRFDRVERPTFSNMKPGTIINGHDPGRPNVLASHSALFAGKLNGAPVIIHSAYVGTNLESPASVSPGWGYSWLSYAHVLNLDAKY